MPRFFKSATAAFCQTAAVLHQSMNVSAIALKNPAIINPPFNASGLINMTKQITGKDLTFEKNSTKQDEFNLSYFVILIMMIFIFFGLELHNVNQQNERESITHRQASV